MKLEDQVTSLGSSNQLRKLGVKQKSYFVWFKLKENDDWSISENWQIYDKERFDTISAFTVAELGEIIPEWFESCKRQNRDWTCRYFEKYNKRSHHSFSINECDARAEMLIYLLENDLIKNS